ncbi:MAG: hypothetical protein KatS3mg113_0055 [Planctomycetaceae bacterium]|nr:MAG: hypothetical protein KatS3mg113_0055 [Planctomycetaceae bacterium]
MSVQPMIALNEMRRVMGMDDRIEVQGCLVAYEVYYP